MIFQFLQKQWRLKEEGGGTIVPKTKLRTQTLNLIFQQIFKDFAKGCY